MVQRLEELRSRLEALEAEVTHQCGTVPKDIGTEDSWQDATGARPYDRDFSKIGTSKVRPRFQNAISSSKSVLNARNDRNDRATVSSLISRLKALDAQRTAERASLQHAIQQERRRAFKSEESARRVLDRLDFREGEVRHLKQALRRRDDLMASLRDQIQELEAGLEKAEKVECLEGKAGIVAVYAYHIFRELLWRCTESTLFTSFCRCFELLLCEITCDNGAEMAATAHCFLQKREMLCKSKCEKRRKRY